MANVPTIFVFTPSASETIACASGNIYTSDIFHLIRNPTPTDVATLISAGCVLLNQRNIVTTTVPTVNDDLTELFGVGSFWVQSSGGTITVYICTNATAGAAVWVQVGFPTTSVIVTGGGTIHGGTIEVFVNNTSAAPITLTLASSEFTRGATVEFVDIANNWETYPVTIAATSGTLRGITGIVETVNSGKDRFVFDGTNWW